MFALTTKSNTYDFYRALEKLTTHDGVKIPKSRYKALMRIVLQWRHLKLLKRGGRGNEPTGAAGTQHGELAIMCPSCPRPDINLPLGWQNAPPAMKYVALSISRSRYAQTSYSHISIQVSLRSHPLHGCELQIKEPARL